MISNNTQKPCEDYPFQTKSKKANVVHYTGAQVEGERVQGEPQGPARPTKDIVSIAKNWKCLKSAGRIDSLSSQNSEKVLL